MPKDKASRRNKFSRWDDDELETPRSSGKDDWKTKNGIHANRKERVRPKRGRADNPTMDADPVQWLQPVSGSSNLDTILDGDEADSSLSLAEIRELANQIDLLAALTAKLMQNVRACGIDFGPDMDQQFAALSKRRSEITTQIQEQSRLYNLESSKLQQSLGDQSALVVPEMIRFESKKQSTYHSLYRQCKKLRSDLQAFHEGIEGLAWNLDQCN